MRANAASLSESPRSPPALTCRRSNNNLTIIARRGPIEAKQAMLACRHQSPRRALVQRMYHLSNRQAKELANGKVLRIAIPYPDTGISGAHRHHDASGSIDLEALEHWYRSVLNTDGQSYLMDWIGIVDVPVNPLNRPDGGLSSIFGATLNSSGLDLHVTIRVVCVVADITIRRRPRAHYPTQWPGRLTVGNLSLP